ncbi:acyl-CoA thioesterase [Halorubrum sp. SY-15]|jgi:acyl-CoA hydrolase|uniref:acyl-CoA thioesterase n=1 Tax=Halorubrum sp. SY-15 TaxID=3402277 RepID=UPI003EBFDEC9
MDETNTSAASTPPDDTERLAVSHTEMTELLVPDDTNSLGRALGGTVLHWMDVCGAIAAMRFAGQQVVTASMEHVDFIAPIEVGEVATIEGFVFDTGRTSLDVTVEVRAADPRTGEHRQTTSSYLTFVALDDDEQPTPVPSLVCPSDEEAARRDRALDARLEQLEQVCARHGL